MESEKTKALEDKVRGFKNFIFDCDGVLWGGVDIIDHSKDFIQWLSKNDKRIFLLTNTSYYSRASVHDKFKALMGIDLPIDNVYTANSLTGQYIKQYLKDKKKAYVIGSKFLVEEIRKSGIEVLPGYTHDEKYGSFSFISKEEMHFRDIDLVVLGYDDNINLYKLAFASYAIQCGATLLSTNADKNTQSPGIPELKIVGNGSFTKLLEAAAETKAIVAGKPNPKIFDTIDAMHGLDKKDCVFIGDNLHTDIKFANDAGVSSVLVLTGVTELHKLDMHLKMKDSGVPDYIFDDLSFKTARGGKLE